MLFWKLSLSQYPAFSVNSNFNLKAGCAFYENDYSGQNVTIDKCNFTVERAESYGVIHGFAGVLINESKINVKDGRCIVSANNVVINSSEINIDSVNAEGNGVTFDSLATIIRNSRIKALNQDRVFNIETEVSESTIEATASEWVYPTVDGTTLFKYTNYGSWIVNIDGAEKTMVSNMIFDNTKAAKSLKVYLYS